MKIDLKELGKRIKLIRKGQDLTQEMLAEKAGVSQHYIYEIESGRKAMSIHSFASLTCALVFLLIIFYLEMNRSCWMSILLHLIIN